MRPTGDEQNLDVVIVGAGFGGIYAVHRLRELGFSAHVFERGDGIGGTWYWNRYPGARCDVESVDYSYSFSSEIEQEWVWTERYATQPEILRYINFVADRLNLREHISLATSVRSAEFDEGSRTWLVKTNRGEQIRARFCILATGCLSEARIPEYPGVEQFSGALFHTADWPRDGADLAGKQVGFIGTGSTGIQCIPRVAREAAHLYVFQRTPNFSIPARNAPLDRSALEAVKADYPGRRQAARESPNGVVVRRTGKSAFDYSEAERTELYEAAWANGGGGLSALFTDLLVDPAANATAADFVRTKIRSLVADPEVAEALCPKDYPFGTKRLCLDTDYYETFNRPNVTLVDLRRQPIVTFEATGITTSERSYNLDAIVFATGFDAMTGAFLAIDIKGREGLSMRTKWADGPQTYLGVMTAGFPNLFMIAGPGSPSVLSNMVGSVEQHVDWVAACMVSLRERGLTVVEATAAAEQRWTERLVQLAERTLLPQANSWYMGANIPGKKRVFSAYLGGVGRYRKICDAVEANGYEGFVLSA